MDKQKLMDVTKPPFDGVSVAAALSGMRDIDSPKSYGCFCFANLKRDMQASIDKAKKYVCSLNLKDYTPAS